MELLNMLLARQLGEAPGYAPINDPKVPTDHGRMLLTLFHRIIDFLRIIKLLYTHTWMQAIRGSTSMSKGVDAAHESSTGEHRSAITSVNAARK